MNQAQQQKTKEETGATLEGATTSDATAQLAKAQPPPPADLAPDAGAQAIVWSRDRIELVKRQICPTGITDDEFAVFIEQCKRTQLDPLIKEAFCVPRRVKIERPNPNGGRPIEQWITKHEFQPAEAGMSARADRFPDFKGIKAAAVYSKDHILIDTDAGTVQHQYNPVGDRGVLVGAWARVYREGRTTPVEFVRLAEYVQRKNTGEAFGQWDQKPETMIVKCARAAAFRRAYPNTFGGLYISEELPEEREVNAPPATPEQEKNGGKTRTESVASKVAAKAGTAPQAQQPRAAASVVDSGPPVARFGEKKGTKLSDLTPAELRELAELGERSLAAANSGASWVPQVKTNVEQIRAELARRPAPQEEEQQHADDPPPAGFEPVALPKEEAGPAPSDDEPF